MTKKSFFDCERKSLENLKKYQFPNYFKKIGIVLFIFSFLLIFVNKFFIGYSEVNLVVKYGMLIGLLFVSVAKEKIEDELIINLKMQSYTFAFIAGVVYSLILPLIYFIQDIIFQSEKALLKDIGDFQILWFLLFVQIIYYEYLKKLYK